MPIRPWLLSTTALASFAATWVVLPAPRAYAADAFLAPDPTLFLPAVSAPNLKLDGFAGTKFDRSFEGGTGALSLPLGQSFGLQIDGMVGAWDGATFAGTAGHFFWRDPNRALIGVYGSYSNLSRFGGVSIGKLAFEGELYLGRFSIETLLGHEGGDIPSRLYAVVDIAHYFTDDFRASIGYRHIRRRRARAGRGMAPSAAKFLRRIDLCRRQDRRQRLSRRMGWLALLFRWSGQDPDPPPPRGRSARSLAGRCSATDSGCAARRPRRHPAAATSAAAATAAPRRRHPRRRRHRRRHRRHRRPIFSSSRRVLVR